MPRTQWCFDSMAYPKTGTQGIYTVTNMESRFPAMRVLWLGREFYRDKYRMTSSSHDLGDHLGDFGDEIWDLKGAGIFDISIRREDTLECTR
ncbi:hypothetical protein AVEN_3659-1 [Araneus ventricosus]|uniref:Uncharacterized protein n=1 Tax=Araneus ventricosus TaxID=182803 RepID=A0A4Y2IQE4_ARAVE|nr:hypothetical protein AVEN_3659-1 [Araneus ventricosus]